MRLQPFLENGLRLSLTIEESNHWKEWFKEHEESFSHMNEPPELCL